MNVSKVNYQSCFHLKTTEKKSNKNLLNSFTVDRIIFSGAKSKEIIALEDVACSMNVKADYGNDLSAAQLFNVALKEVKDAGFKLPKKVKMSHEKFYARSIKPAFYDTKYKTIFLNEFYDWHDSESLNKGSYLRKNQSTDNKLHKLYHEMGHAIHDRVSPLRFGWHSFSFGFDYEEKVEISKHFGDYAAESPLEFVAECFAGIMDGKKYPREFIESYCFLGGPRNMPKKDFIEAYSC